MTLRRRQQIWYILADLISSELVWLCFLAFRWMVYDGRVESLKDVLVPAFNFWPPLIVYPIVCMGIYYLSGYYLRPFQKPLWREFLRTIVSAAVIALLFFFIIIIDDPTENYKHYLELTEKEKDEVFTSRVKLSVWLDMDNRNKRWKKIEERQQSINDLIANKQYDQLAVESRKTWRIYLDLMANNYVSYENMKDYFRFLTKVSLPLVRNGWEDKGPIREMLAESSHLLTNVMLLQIQRAECYVWEDIKKRRFPYYPYTESNNKPYEKEAMDALMQWLDLLIDESKLVSEEAQTLKKAVLSVL